MIKLKNYLFCLIGASVMMNGSAQSNDPNDYALMTAQDLRANSLSNITITNRTPAPVAVGGLFIASFDTTSSNDCSVCSGSVMGGDNVGGVMVSPATFQVNQAAPVGQNYLYNMIFNGIYYIRNSVGSSPCNLPGCSWPGDTPNIKWCVSINAISLNSSYTYNPTYKNGSNPAAAVPAYGAAGLSSPAQFNYNYDLVNPNTLGSGNSCFGPVTCNDKTLTCSVSTPQNESFAPYTTAK